MGQMRAPKGGHTGRRQYCRGGGGVSFWFCAPTLTSLCDSQIKAGYFVELLKISEWAE